MLQEGRINKVPRSMAGTIQVKVKILQYSLALRESITGCKVKMMFISSRTGNYHQEVGSFFLFSLSAITPQWALAFLINEICFFYITHDKPQSVGLLWASYQLVAETST
jgi:hypothetical protein